MSKRIKFAVGAARQRIQDKFGGPVTEQQTLRDPSGQIIACQGNGDRVGLTFINGNSLTKVCLSLTFAQAQANQGIILEAGAVFNMNVEEDFTLTTAQWYMASVGIGPLVVIEVLRTHLSEQDQP